MKGFTDLQTQTHFSDGDLSPTALVRLARSHGITTLAITDHDSVAGISEAQKAGRRYGVRIIPGIELYARFRGREIHILGYMIQVRHKALLRSLRTIQRQHRAWLAGVCKKLSADGWEIQVEDFAASHSELIGFRELLTVLESRPANKRRLKKEFGTATPDLFAVINRYFAGEGIAALPLPEKRLSAQRAIRLIRAAGGVAVLAHPGQHFSFEDDGLIRELKRLGLRGIEAITPHHTWHQMLHYQVLARQLRLFVTAGSDFHELLDLSFTTRTRWDVFRISQNPLPWKNR